MSDDGFIAYINGIGNVFIKYDAAGSKIQVFDTVVVEYDSEDLVVENGQYIDVAGENVTYSYKLNNPESVRKADPSKGEPVFG